jgi:hypothetical protein
MQPSDSLPPSATALVPLACGLPRCGRLCCAFAADDTCARHVSCVGDGSPALRHPGVYRGEARASQVTGPSSASVPWSHTPPDMVHSSPTTRRSPWCLQVHQDPGHPGRVEVSGPPAPWPTRSPAYASPRPFLTPAQGWLPARVGSPLAGQDAHLLDDTQSFMKALHPPVPIDPHCLVALIFLYSAVTAGALVGQSMPPRQAGRPAGFMPSSLRPEVRSPTSEVVGRATITCFIR